MIRVISRAVGLPDIWNMKTILVLTDFSINADHAAHYALKLAQQINAGILLCNIYPEPAMITVPSEPFSYSENFGGFEKDSQDDLKELAGRLRQSLENNGEEDLMPLLEICSKPGPLIPAINRLIAERDILFAVIATHNKDDVLAFLNGNHAHEIIEQVNCPVLVLPYQVPYNGFHKIAFTTDLSHNADSILCSLYELTKFFDAEVLIAHVGRAKLGKPTEDYITRKFIGTEIGATHYPKVQYRAVQNNSAAAGLHWLAGQKDIDLVVLVHHKRNILQKIFLPSITKKLADHLVKPMLVFPEVYQRVSVPA